MTAATATPDLLTAYLTPFMDLAGDRRIALLLGDTIRGIIGSESSVCARIAASPLGWPMAAIVSGGFAAC